MIGEDQAGVLEFQDESSNAAQHLFCLKDACRFYRKKDTECSFDVLFEQVEAQAKSAGESAATKKTLDNVTSELNKFWALQTKSVAELIDSIGETEKNSTEAIARLEENVLGRLEKAIDERGSSELEGISAELRQLRESLDSREEGAEALSSTISEVIMNIEDRLKELRDQSNDLSSRVGKLESSFPGGDQIRSWIGDSLASDDVKSLKEQFDTFIQANSRFEKQLGEWQERIDDRVDEIRDSQSNVVESLEGLASARPATNAGEEKAAAERKRKARKLNNLGVTSFHNGELELARDQFVEAVGLDDGFAECYNNLGLVYTELGAEEKATEAFSTAIRINPDLHAAYNNLGYVFYRQGIYDQAVEMYNEALGRSASNSSAYTNLGNAYFKQGKRDEARKAWEKALELDPSNRQASRSLKELEREKV
jgi:tetratricopeptide (TPR) repeat protein